MLPRSQRLPRESFDSLMKDGAIFHSDLFMARATQRGVEKTRISAVVPQKVGKTAVTRILLRRKMYATIKDLVSLVSPVHAVIFAKTKALEAGKEDLNKDLRNLFVKMGILR